MLFIPFRARDNYECPFDARISGYNLVYYYIFNAAVSTCMIGSRSVTRSNRCQQTNNAATFFLALARAQQIPGGAYYTTLVFFLFFFFFPKPFSLVMLSSHTHTAYSSMHKKERSLLAASTPATQLASQLVLPDNSQHQLIGALAVISNQLSPQLSQLQLDTCSSQSSSSSNLALPAARM